MRLVRFESNGEAHLGVSFDDGASPDGTDTAIDLTPLVADRFGWRITDVGDYLSHGVELDNWVEGLRESEVRASLAEYPISELSLLAPVGSAALVIGLGRNFAEHAREMRTPGGGPASHGSASDLHGFVKSARSLTGSGRDILLPRAHPDRVDYEGEIGVVIGRRCHAIGVDEADDYIAGYVLLNDVSARDWIPQVRSAEGSDAIRLAWDSNTLGKQFPTFCPMGPFFVPKRHAAPVNEIELSTFVNDELRQHSSLSDLNVGPAEMVAHYAAYYEFQPGDIVTTGTPAGVGIGMKPPQFLRAGDRMTITATSLGTLENRVVASQRTGLA